MKRIIAAALILLMISASAIAEIDLSGLSYSELVEMRDAVQREIISRPEWKEVTVPAGEWVVGVDIPAGSYSMIPAGDSAVVHLWGQAVDDYNAGGGMLISKLIERKEGGYGKLNFKDGNVLQLKNPVILAPAVGLGF